MLRNVAVQLKCRSYGKKFVLPTFSDANDFNLSLMASPSSSVVLPYLPKSYCPSHIALPKKPTTFLSHGLLMGYFCNKLKFTLAFLFLGLHVHV